MGMISLWREPVYRFDFDSCRKVERMHLSGAVQGAIARLCRAEEGQPGPTVAEGVVGEDGWVQWETPLITQPGDRFLAVVDPMPCAGST